MYGGLKVDHSNLTLCDNHYWKEAIILTYKLDLYYMYLPEEVKPVRNSQDAETLY